MKTIRQFISGFVLVWILMIVVGLILLGASTHHRAPEMIQKEQAWHAAGEEANAAAAEIERRAAAEGNVPPRMGSGKWLEH